MLVLLLDAAKVFACRSVSLWIWHNSIALASVYSPSLNIIFLILSLITPHTSLSLMSSSLFLKSLMYASMVSPGFWFLILNLWHSIVTFICGLDNSQNFRLIHSGFSLVSSVIALLPPHTRLVHTQTCDGFPLDGFWAEQVKENKCLRLGIFVWVSSCYKYIAFLLEYPPVLTNVAIKHRSLGLSDVLSETFLFFFFLKSFRWNLTFFKGVLFSTNHLLTPCWILDT